MASGELPATDWQEPPLRRLQPSDMELSAGAEKAGAG